MSLDYDHITREQRMSGVHSNLWDEIEVYFDSNVDRAVLGGTILAVVIGITLMLWTPDVEAIGTWFYQFIN